MRYRTALKVMAAIIVFLLVVPWLVPMATYRAQLEQQATSLLGAPVHIDALHFALLPTPRVNIRGIVVGSDAEIQVRQVAAVLDVATLFKPVKVLSSLKIENPVVKPAAIDLLKPLFAGKSEAPLVAIRNIEIRQLKLDWPGLALPLMNANVAMTDAGQIEAAVLASEDDKLKVEAKPKGDGYDAIITASQWTPPMGPAIRLDKLNVRLVYAGNTLDVTTLEADLYGGKLKASAHLDWASAWKLKGKLKTDAIELRDLTKLFSKSVTLSGRISGNGEFSSSAKSADRMLDKLVLDYVFHVSRGVLHGMDLAKAASLFIRQSGQGGETEFDELSGKVHTAGKQIDLHNIKVASGLIAAQGNVRISPAKALDGKVDVELKKGLALVTVPLKVSGTLEAPEVMPTKAAIAGAAAGTAVLGPMGTSIGMKAGAALDSLFGSKK